MAGREQGVYSPSSGWLCSCQPRKRVSRKVLTKRGPDCGKLFFVCSGLSEDAVSGDPAKKGDHTSCGMYLCDNDDAKTREDEVIEAALIDIEHSDSSAMKSTLRQARRRFEWVNGLVHRVIGTIEVAQLDVPLSFQPMQAGIEFLSPSVKETFLELGRQPPASLSASPTAMAHSRKRARSSLNADQVLSHQSTPTDEGFLYDQQELLSQQDHSPSKLPKRGSLALRHTKSRLSTPPPTEDRILATTDVLGYRVRHSHIVSTPTSPYQLYQNQVNQDNSPTPFSLTEVDICQLVRILETKVAAMDKERRDRHIREHQLQKRILELEAEVLKLKGNKPKQEIQVD